MENNKLQTEIRKFKCPYCGKKHKTLMTLKRHILNEHIINEISCPYCGEKFKSLKSFQKHLYFKKDNFHYNLYLLITRRYFGYVDKKIFI